MARVSATSAFVILLSFVCIDTLIPYGLAQKTTTNTSPSLPKQTPTPIPQDVSISTCLPPLESIAGCLDQIKKAITNDGKSNIGPACCKVINSLNDACWALLFPDFPQVPAIIKGVCFFIGRPLPSTPKELN